MTDKIIDIEVVTRNLEIFNSFSKDIEAIYSDCQSINQTYEMLSVAIDSVKDDYVFVTVKGVVLPTNIQTVESYQQYLEKRFEGYAEYDNISNLWEKENPRNLKEAKNLVVTALESEISDWLLPCY